MQQKTTFKNFNGQGVTMAAVINFPEGFDEKKQYPAVVVAHPGGGVKEQTAGTYAKRLAEHGLITIAFDASFQGESTGMPRQLENPYIRTEDISAVIDYLTTLPYVDNERIGAMGVCAGGGYAATQQLTTIALKLWELSVQSISVRCFVMAGRITSRTRMLCLTLFTVLRSVPMMQMALSRELCL